MGLVKDEKPVFSRAENLVLIGPPGMGKTGLA